MAIALRHRIGARVNENELYVEKYARDAEIIMNEAEKVVEQFNWSRKDKQIIKNKLTKKLYQELKKKEFIHEDKFGLIDQEVKQALLEFGLWVE